LYTSRQRITGHEVVELTSWNNAESEAKSWQETYGRNWNENESVARPPSGRVIRSEGEAEGRTEQTAKGGNRSTTHTHGSSQHLKPVHEDYRELSGITYYTGDEWDRVWARKLRTLPTGVALLRLVNDAKLHEIAVENPAFGYLSWDRAQLKKRLPQVLDRLDELLAKNFQSEFFTTPDVIEQEMKQRLHQVLKRQGTVIDVTPVAADDETESDTGSPRKFRRMAKHSEVDDLMS
jgi:hypothetical protein